MYLVIVTPKWTIDEIETYAKNTIAANFLPNSDGVDVIDTFWVMETYPKYTVSVVEVKGYPPTKVLLCMCGEEFKRLDNVFFLNRMVSEIETVWREQLAELPQEEIVVRALAHQLAPRYGASKYCPKLVSVPQDETISAVWMYERWNGQISKKLPFAVK